MTNPRALQTRQYLCVKVVVLDIIIQKTSVPELVLLRRNLHALLTWTKQDPEVEGQFRG